MSGRQRVALNLGFLVVGIACLFPPWCFGYVDADGLAHTFGMGVGTWWAPPSTGFSTGLEIPEGSTELPEAICWWNLGLVVLLLVAATAAVVMALGWIGRPSNPR